MSKGRGYLSVRATVDDSIDKQRFDDWYETVHVPDVIQRLRATTAYRMWSIDDPNVHYAIYEFNSLDTLLTQVAGPDMQELIADFDAAWGVHVGRERTLLRGA